MTIKDVLIKAGCINDIAQALAEIEGMVVPSVGDIRKKLVASSTIDPLPPYRCLPPIDETTADVKATEIHAMLKERVK